MSDNKTTDAQWVGAVIRGVIVGAPMEGAFQDERISRAAEHIVKHIKPTSKAPPGLDEDGMCNDHGAFMCKRCCPEVRGEN